MSATETGLVRTYENPPKASSTSAAARTCPTPVGSATSSYAGRRRVLARRREEPDAAAHLRHGLGTKKALAAHLHRLEEAEKRDHRKLGAELDLFSFPDEIGSGLAVFHPKGGIVRRLMEDYSRQRHEQAGYEFVYSPHITKAELFEKSGHLDWYADGMFPPDGARRRHRLLPQADELPVPHPDLPEPAALVPRAAACGSSSSARCTATRSRAWCTASPASAA